MMPRFPKLPFHRRKLAHPRGPVRLNLEENALNRTIWRLAVPAIIGNVMFTVVHLSDTLIVGWLRDENALAAAALAMTLTWLINAPFHALSISASSMVSRYWGEEDIATSRTACGQTLGVAFVLSTALVALAWPAAPGVLRFLGASETVVHLGAPYFRLILLSALLGLPMIVAVGAIRGTGDTRTPMILTILMNVVNVVCSIVLAFGIGPLPAMGLMGVGWGTAIARSVGGVASLLVLAFASRGMRLRLRDCVDFNARVARQVIRLGSPAMLERLINSAAHLVFMRIVALLGTTALAAHNIALNIESLVFMPLLGLSAASSTVLGQAIGARRPQIAELAVRRALVWTGVFSVGFGLVFVAFAPQIVILFGATRDVLGLAGRCLQVCALELPFLGFAIILSGALRGAGDTRSPLLASLTGVVFFRLIAVYTFGVLLGWGLVGVWLGTAFDWAARSLGLWFFFRRGVWKTVHEREKARLAETAQRIAATATSEDEPCDAAGEG